MSADRRCETCPCWARETIYTGPKSEIKVAQCRRHAPRYGDYNPQGAPWPYTQAHDWCHEHPLFGAGASHER